MKSLLFIIFLFISVRASAPDLKLTLIPRSVPVNPFDKLIHAVMMVESGGNVMAYNAEEEATGPLQIRPIRLNDYNKRTGNNYTIKQCYDLEISKKIFLYYASLTGFPYYEKIARSWNGSGQMTIEYWKKVKSQLHKISI